MSNRIFNNPPLCLKIIPYILVLRLNVSILYLFTPFPLCPDTFQSKFYTNTEDEDEASFAVVPPATQHVFRGLQRQMNI